ncbi:MGDG synthase family glycosyltransferase [Deinococcus hohokamensis]|uniref:Glycosyltransferase n=1 Tax=Deinococcus hohokamensis TaxID=309883 RepID=A0ABV9IBI5_9DEIO
MSEPGACGGARPLPSLFVTASIGSGHHQVQLAVKEALRARGVLTEARESDVTAYLKPSERWWTVDLYAFELRHAPWLYAWFYRATDHDRPFSLIGSFCRWVGLRGMQRDLAETQPEVVVSSYWSSVPLAETARRRSGQQFLNALIVTDYRAHRHWIRPEADLIMVAAQETAEQMLARGADPAKVVVTGIPISARFAGLIGADQTDLRRRHGLRPDLPLLLVSGGGKGDYHALHELLAELGNLGRPVQVLLPAGTQKRGEEQLGGATIHHLGYTTDFPELLAASDLVVGKAGGLTVTEATALGVPVVVYAPIPGQEEHNAEFLERHGAGVWVRDRRALGGAVMRALDPQEHAAMSRAARALGVPDAADRVARTLLERLGRL